MSTPITIRPWVPIARNLFRNAVRSPWVILLGVLYAVVAEGMLLAGGGGERVLVSLINVVLLLVPLVSLVFGTVYLYGARDFVLLLLAVTGYISTTAGETVAQPPLAITGVTLAFSLLPVMLVASSLPLIWRYPLRESLRG